MPGVPSKGVAVGKAGEADADGDQAWMDDQRQVAARSPAVPVSPLLQAVRSRPGPIVPGVGGVLEVVAASL